MEVGLHRVKVKAWDNTITTFPQQSFLNILLRIGEECKKVVDEELKEELFYLFLQLNLLMNFLKELSHLVLLKDYLKNKNIELKKLMHL